MKKINTENECTQSAESFSLCKPDGRKRWEPTLITEWTDAHLDACEDFVLRGLVNPIYMNMTEHDQRKGIVLAGSRSLKRLVEKLNNET